MENFRNFFKKEKWTKGLTLSFLLFLTPFVSSAASIREVSQNIERVRAIQPPFRFALIGDSRDGEKIYTQLMKRILERKPNFVIHLGDMVAKPHEKDWREFFEMSKSIDLPFFPVMGNHEGGGTLRGEEMYQKQFILPEGKTYYAFRVGGCLFVVLDSEKEKGKIVGEQWSWLEDTLSSSNEKFRFVFIHRPLFLPMDSFKTGRAMDKYPVERDRLHQLFIKSGVKTVFAGDDHRYDRTERSNILYIITGGGGAPIYTLKESGGYFHYVWVSVEGGRMGGEVVNLDGQIQDRFVIE